MGRKRGGGGGRGNVLIPFSRNGGSNWFQIAVAFPLPVPLSLFAVETSDVIAEN